MVACIVFKTEGVLKPINPELSTTSVLSQVLRPDLPGPSACCGSCGSCGSCSGPVPEAGSGRLSQGLCKLLLLLLLLPTNLCPLAPRGLKLRSCACPLRLLRLLRLLRRLRRRAGLVRRQAHLSSEEIKGGGGEGKHGSDDNEERQQTMRG